MSRILGVSAHYHDSAVCLLDDGRIVAAAQEERFTRKKYDASFPEHALRYCLAEGGDGPIDAVAFYDKPILKLHRVLETSLATAPRGLSVFLRSVPSMFREKLFIEPELRGALDRAGAHGDPSFHFPEHHLSHAASAFYPSPLPRAAVVTLDGVGEWSTTTISLGDGSNLSMLRELRFPHSIGLLYSAFTAYCGFRVLDGEYKLMGLAPYGEPRFVDDIRQHLIDLKEDGSFRLDMQYFGFLDGLEMTNRRFERLFGGPPREPDAPITQRELDLACSVQRVTEEVVLRVARHARQLTGSNALCLAGGVALNCVANGKLLREGSFEHIWIQPAAGDAGGALGAAYAVHHLDRGAPRPQLIDRMCGAALGPQFSTQTLERFLEDLGVAFERHEDQATWAERIAELVDQGAVVGLFQGRMEYGPRALGNRSIIADPRRADMQTKLNGKIKRRESFRPFAPSVLAERAGEWFELEEASPYMLLVAAVRSADSTETVEDRTDLAARLAAVVSDVPAVTHVDGSARVQTVRDADNPRYHALLSAFEARTGCPVLVNTSFNVRGEPIVCTPRDAYRCFRATGMDALSLGPFVLTR